MPDRETTVTTYAGYRAGERPKSFVAGGKLVEVRAIEKRWIEEDRDSRKRKRFFVVQGSDGKEYTLVFDEYSGVWLLREK